MYSRSEAEDSFGVSGKLWRDALVMYDRRTGTLWSQIDGRAVRGDRKGEKLEPYPSVLTTWGEWRRRYPETRVLQKDERDRKVTRSIYEDYFRNPGRIGVTRSTPELREETGIGSKEKVLGVFVEGIGVAYPLGRLEEHPVVHDRVGDRDILVAYDAPAGTARAFLARTAEGPARFRADRGPEGELRLDSDGALFDALSGRRLDREGPGLEPVTSQISYWYAWHSFFPRSRVWQP